MSDRKISDILRVEIQEQPQWSFLWFRPDNNDNGVALVMTNSSSQIEHLKKLQETLKEL